MILTTSSNYITFIILNLIFICIATITIMIFINEKEKKINDNINEKINHLEEKIDKKRKRPRGIIEKESKN